MTREEAKEFIAQSVKSDIDMALVADAIKVLEQQTCEDAVSRNLITQTLNKMDRYVAEELTLCDTDKKFPKNEVFIVDDVYEQIVEQLPPVNPQRTGHWIFDEILDKHYYCSECKSMGVDYWDFCPNCGARMVEPQESEKINCKATKCENCKNHNYCDYEP